MKNLAMLRPPYFLVGVAFGAAADAGAAAAGAGAALALGAEGAPAGVHGRGLTGAPGFTFCRPSTITVSPAFKPEPMIQLLP